MRWPADHPLRTDAALQPFAAAAADLIPDARGVRVLRQLPGRRVATLVDFGDRQAVLKVFASPRARGNHRRLSVLAAGPARPIVPTSFGTDPSGHVHLISYHPGVELDQLSENDDFVVAAHRAGIALRRLHDSGAAVDRYWGWPQESAQLVRQAIPSTVGRVVRALADGPGPGAAEWVSSHRDCHPGQVIVDAAGDVRWVDLDDCAMAPRALDLGNMVAHLRREHLRGARDREVAGAAESQFLLGYQLRSVPSIFGLDSWIDVAMLRLAALAVTRHRDWPLHDALLLARQPQSAAGSAAQAFVESAAGPISVSR